MRRRMTIVTITIACLALRLASAVVVAQPGYTDAYYYADVAGRLARGLGLTADFVWSPLELGALPVVSHRFWMPMATALQALGIAPLGASIGDFRAAQSVIVLVAACIPALAFAAARTLGATTRSAFAAALAAGLGGLFAPAWVSVDGFAPAAVLGGLFFIAFAHASHGAARAGALAGVLVGLLYLTRAETALFGLALVALLARPSTRAAGIAGCVTALAIGGTWLARNIAAGTPPDYVTRAFLLVRYEDFFALAVPHDITSAPLADVLGQRLGALGANATTFLFAFALVLIVPLAAGIRAAWSRPEVRAWSLLALGVYLAESLLWTLHSTRGSYFHSLAAFFCFGLAIAAVGADRLLAERRPEILSAWNAGALVLVAAVSFGAVQQWDASFNTAARVRSAALDAIPAGTFLAIDAAAWRWLSGRSVLVTPSDGLSAAACVASGANARALVLEEAHFSAYDDLYRGGVRPAWLGVPIERGTVKIFPITGELDLRCGGA